MPRKKKAPQHVDKASAKAQQWQMGQAGGAPQDQDEVEVLQVESCSDEEWSEEIGRAPAKKKRKPSGDTKNLTVKQKKRLSDQRRAALAEDYEKLQLLLDASDFFITVSPKRLPIVGTLGNFEFSLQDGETWPDKEEEEDNGFWIYVSSVPSMSFAYLQRFVRHPSESLRDFAERQKKATDPDSFDVVKLDLIPEVALLEAFGPNIGPKRRGSLLQFDGLKGSVLNVKVTVTEETLVKMSHPSSLPSITVPECAKITLNHFLGLGPEEDEGAASNGYTSERPDIDELYEVVKKYHDKTGAERVSEIDPQHPSLLPQLRPYQKAAVRWMLAREKAGLNTNGAEQLHTLYHEVKTLEGDSLYYNRKGGFLVKDKPLALPHPPGGILADEMGLGKTVEILSLMLCHPKPDVPKPEYLEPIALKKDKKKLRRRRSPSPVEFVLDPPEEKPEVVGEESGDHTSLPEDMEEEILEDNDDNDEDPDAEPAKKASEKDVLMQVDGANDEFKTEEDSSSDGEYIPRPSTSRGGGRSRIADDPGSSASDSEESASEENSSDDDAGDRGSKRSVRTKRRSPHVRFRKDLVESAVKKKRAGEAMGKGILKRTTNRAAEDSGREFDPASILQGRVVTKKSPLTDIILQTVITLDKRNGDGASVQLIKKHLAEKYEKSNLQQFKKALAKLVKLGQLVNTTGQSGASGSFKVNPDYDSFDTRGFYVDQPLDNIDQVIEDVITEHCYDGKAYSKEEVEASMSVHRKAKKEPSTFQKLKSLYDARMAEMSEACELTEEYKKARKRWNGSFFDTKVQQSEFFECICGAEAHEAEYDGKYRVQCVECKLHQHAECVKYDVGNPYRGAYVCPHCWTLREPVESGATLIVSPGSISYQWIEEIRKHVRRKNVKMLFYEGTKKAGYIQPRALASYDIVVTTYGVLQSETNYVDLPHSNSAEGRRFRQPKRFMAVPAPLPCVRWWRIALDEAQMIECATNRTAEMALRLKADNRWCVTGTPIEKSLNDLQGLLLFLQEDPYSLPHWWRSCLFEPYLRGHRQTLESVLCRLLWRTAKRYVLHQINIPSQTEEMHWLNFSPIEEHFYRRQHVECSKQAVATIRRHSDLDLKLSSLDRNTLQTLLAPVLRLRQSCCHPQAVRGQFTTLKQTSENKVPLTMEGLLEQMIKKAVTECEDSHRLIVAALNGLAGVDIIEGNWAAAVEKYREVLRSAEEHKDMIKTDSLQRLHTLINLAELLEANHENITPTLRDASLREEARELQTNYLAKYQTAVRASKEAALSTTELVESLRNSFLARSSSDDRAWYEKVIDLASLSSEDEDGLMKLVRDEMAQFFDVVNDKEFRQIEQKYPGPRVVLYKVAEKVAEFDSMRENVCQKINALESSPPDSFVNAAVDCHLRVSAVNQQRKNKKVCRLCEVHDDIEVYESLIFHFVKDEIKAAKGSKIRAAITSEEEKKLEEKGVYLLQDQRKGTWADSEVERLLRALLKFARGRPSSELGPVVTSDGSNHLRLIEVMKKEFRLLRILWRQIYDHVAGVDEVNMSLLRLRLRYEDEPATNQGALKRKKPSGPNLSTREKDKFETIYILEEHELSAQKLKLSSERTVANAEFRKRRGQLLYLQNLKKSDYGRRGGGENPEPCPICQQALGTQWSVLQCGHCYCISCVEVLMRNYSSVGNNKRSVRCPVCRNSSYHAEISFVSTQAEENDGDNDPEEDHRAYEAVRGSLSTKMEAVVRTLIKIRTDDPKAKCLVFSTWTDVLDILSSALAENNIAFAALHAQGKFKRNLLKFKNRDDVQVLLLPITSGANGLNLVEASHVLLVEPILNPAQELQAIGRVHRIGQSKPTVVHRFVIKATIEERMHKILSSYHTEESQQGSHSTEENLLTLRDLKNIFVDEDE